MLIEVLHSHLEAFLDTLRRQVRDRLQRKVSHNHTKHPLCPNHLKNNEFDFRCVKQEGSPFSTRASQDVGTLSGTATFALSLALQRVKNLNIDKQVILHIFCLMFGKNEANNYQQKIPPSP